MREADFQAFTELLDAVCGLLSRGSYIPSPTNSALWFRALQAHPIEVVRAGFDGHVKNPQRGRFVPTPADIIAQIEGLVENDGRPGVEEAWAMTVAGRDEAETIVWTQEMAQAWGVAKPVMDSGDEVGARMAFKQAYTRLVESSRRQRIQAVWSASLGFDSERRAAVIGAAVADGRLSESELLGLPAPRSASVALLEVSTSHAPEHIREKLRTLRERLTMPRNDDQSLDALAKADTEQRKIEAANKVRDYLSGDQL